MNRLSKACFTLFFMAVAAVSFAQAGLPPAPAVNAEREIAVKNSSERPVVIFAGPKENIREPKLSTFGGLSTNKVWLRTGDIVCMMTAWKTPTACTVVKAETNTVEINSSGTLISGK